MVYLFTWRGEKTPTQAGAEPAINKDYKLNIKGETTMFDNEMDDLNLGDLFRMADSVGDKYLTESELAQRSADLLKAQAELDKIIEKLNLDD